MSDRSKKISELPVATIVANTDLFIIDKATGNTSNITANNLFNAMETRIVRGPYDTDVQAGTGGVGVGKFYYTSTGAVKVRLT